MRSSVRTVFTSLTVQRIHSSSMFSKPFLTRAARTSWSVKMRAVVALGGFVQLDGVVLDGGGLELLGDALLHVARRLPDLEQTRVRLVVDGVGVDARTCFRLRRKDFLDRAYSSSLSLRFIGRNLRLDEGLLFRRDTVLLVKVFVCPSAIPCLHRHPSIGGVRRVLSDLSQRDEESKKPRGVVRLEAFCSAA